MKRQNIVKSISGDGLVKVLLKLNKAINENAISATLKGLGQQGARRLQTLLLSKNAGWLCESGLKSITLDADSTVKSVCGKQEGAAKGYTTTKQGAKSYHPLLVFVSEIKLCTIHCSEQVRLIHPTVLSVFFRM